MAAETITGRKVGRIWADADDLERNASRAMAGGLAVDSVEVGRDLRGEQHWVVSRVTPIDPALVLVVEEDVTARLRLQALRVLTGLHPDVIEGKVRH